MIHYPFADEAGSVGAILTARQASIPLSEMGAPARARVIQVTYASMLSGRKSMRISDVPEALDDLGLATPSKILSYIYALGIELESVVLERNTNVSISLPQFIRLVEACLDPHTLSRRASRNPSSSSSAAVYQRRAASSSSSPRAPQYTQHNFISEEESIEHNFLVAGEGQDSLDTESIVSNVVEEAVHLRARKAEKGNSSQPQQPQHSDEMKMARSKTMPRERVSGLFSNTASSKLRQQQRKSLSSSHKVATDHVEAQKGTESDQRHPSSYVDNHTLRLRRAKSKISGSVMRDKSLNKKDTSIPAHDKRQDFQKPIQGADREERGASSFGYDYQYKGDGEEDGADEVMSTTSSVIESAEAFLRTSRLQTTSPLRSNTGSLNALMDKDSAPPPAQQVC